MEEVGVFEDLLGEFALPLGKRALEGVERLSLSVEEFGLDAEREFGAGPTVAGGLADIEKPFRRVLQGIENFEVMAPRDLCNRLLHNLPVGPGLRELPHVFEVSG